MEDHEIQLSPASKPEISVRRPAGVAALSLFFLFGVLASGLAAIMLLLPGAPLDVLWRLNPRAHQGLSAMGSPAVVLMCGVCLACAAAAWGLWRLRLWGLWTAMAVLSVNLIGDTMNFLLRQDWRSLPGVPIAGLMIVYLFKKKAIFKR